ncbi:MAG TPA: carboxyltransferase domain-containing protein, partial [Labilithrix sp.]|nr:carboxyltransferase domain-containing protein [Labilithrix sp.]
AQYTGIYPYASPGGWHLLGRASAFDPFAAGGGHATFAIGDIVRFSPCALGSSATVTPTTGERRARSPSGPPRAHLEVTRAAGFAILVDAGRPGRMHEGVPPGGPLVRSLFARANEVAGNPSHACAIEVSGSIEVTARGGSVLVADDDAAVVLAEGERHVVSTAGSTRVRYLAVAGGIDAPVVLGGRGTLLVAGIGRLLRRGDCLQPDVSGGDLQAPAASVLVGPGGFAPAREPIAIMAGPDAAGISLDALAKRSFRVGAASDRTGTRLESVDPSALEQDVTQPKSEALTRRSTPMVVGAIEQTPSGLIVLGPDHPTTGGYPVVAVVVSSSLDDFFALPIGAHLRFVVRG